MQDNYVRENIYSDEIRQLRYARKLDAAIAKCKGMS